MQPLLKGPSGEIEKIGLMIDAIHYSIRMMTSRSRNKHIDCFLSAVEHPWIALGNIQQNQRLEILLNAGEVSCIKMLQLLVHAGKALNPNSSTALIFWGKPALLCKATMLLHVIWRVTEAKWTRSHRATWSGSWIAPMFSMLAAQERSAWSQYRRKH